MASRQVDDSGTLACALIGSGPIKDLQCASDLRRDFYTIVVADSQQCAPGKVRPVGNGDHFCSINSFARGYHAEAAAELREAFVTVATPEISQRVANDFVEFVGLLCVLAMAAAVARPTQEPIE